MYHTDPPHHSGKKILLSPTPWKQLRHISSGVFFLGLTSFFTDISSEMITAVLPLYAVFFLQLPILQYGLLDGLHQGASVLVRLLAGFVSDRFRKPKEVATSGYALSAISKVLLLVGQKTGGFLSGIILIDRIGKGIRTPPRDALIAKNTDPQSLATAFGVHRALDTAGAMIGPLVATGLLFILPGDYQIIFIVSIAFAVIGLATIFLFVGNTSVNPEALQEQQPRARDFLLLLKLPQLRSLFIVSSLLGVATLSDSFIYFTISRAVNIPIHLFPLLYVVTAFIYMMLAIPAGMVADRVGKRNVFIGGYALIALVYAALLFSTLHIAVIILILVALGIFYATTDGVLAAQANELLPDNLRSTGTALIATGTGVAKIASSFVYGILWTTMSQRAALTSFLVALSCVVIYAMIFMRYKITTSQTHV